MIQADVSVTVSVAHACWSDGSGQQFNSSDRLEKTDGN